MMMKLTYALILLSFSASPQTSPTKACENSTVDALGPESAAHARAFLADLQTAVKATDKQQVAAMAEYPVRWIVAGARKSIKTRADFIAQYDRILTPHILEAIASQSAACLFGNSQGAMVGNGEVWFQEQTNGAWRIVTIQSGKP